MNNNTRYDDNSNHDANDVDGDVISQTFEVGSLRSLSSSSNRHPNHHGSVGRFVVGSSSPPSGVPALQAGSFDSTRNDSEGFF